MANATDENNRKMPSGEEGKQKPAPKTGIANFGDKVNRKGRPKGCKNKADRDVRDSVLKAFDKLGRHEYLMKLANGTVSQQVAFTNLLSKCITKEISGSINHNIIPKLPWLAQRMVDKVSPTDAESLGTAGKSLSHQDVVEGEIVQRVDGVPVGHPTGTHGDGDE